MKANGLLLITLTLLLILTACGAQSEQARTTRTYEHLAFESSIEKGDCLLCGESPDHEIGLYLGQDNVGLVNMNTFDVGPVGINRYEGGKLLEEATGTFQMSRGDLGDTNAWAYTDVDRGYASIQIGVSNAKLDTTAAAAFLCQDCLDAYAKRFFEDDNVSVIGVVNFSTREIRPLVDTCPFFSSDNYLIDCDFEEDGGIDLRVTYRPVRYHKTT